MTKFFLSLCIFLGIGLCAAQAQDFVRAIPRANSDTRIIRADVSHPLGIEITVNTSDTTSYAVVLDSLNGNTITSIDTVRMTRCPAAETVDFDVSRSFRDGAIFGVSKTADGFTYEYRTPNASCSLMPQYQGATVVLDNVIDFKFATPYVDQSTSKIYVHGFAYTEPLAANVTYRQFVAEFDLATGNQTGFVLSNDEITSVFNSPRSVVGIFPGYGVITTPLYGSSSSGFDLYATTLDGTSNFIGIEGAYGQCGVTPVNINVYPTGEISFRAGGCAGGRATSSPIDYAILNSDEANPIEIGSLDGAPSGFIPFANSPGDRYRRTSDLSLVGNRYYTKAQGGEPREAFSIFRTNLYTNKVFHDYYDFPIDFLDVYDTPSGGAIAFGATADSLYVIQIDGRFLINTNQAISQVGQVFPNPTTGRARFSLPAESGRVLAQAEPFEIYSSMGQLVASGNLESGGWLDASQLAPSVYTVILRDAGVSGKLVVVD